MSQTERLSMDKLLAQHSAPTLLERKCANLISVRNTTPQIAQYTDFFNDTAGKYGFFIRILCRCRENTLLLVYNRKRLSDRLCCPEMQELLSPFGYPEDADIDRSLDRLSRRLSFHEEFPHEIGVFLDYPYEDIVGFIRNRGRDCKMCGYWKVYGDTEYACRTFQTFDRCREYLCSKLNSGVDIFSAIHHYQEVHSA